MTNEQIKSEAIKAFKDIQEGKVKGVKLRQFKYIKTGSITFEI